MPNTEITSKNTTTTTTDKNSCCGSSDSKLIFPKQITPSQQKIIHRLLSGYPEAQTILDELAGRMKVTEVKNPIGYVKGILQNKGSDEFEPELALGVAEARAAQKRREEENQNTQRQKETKKSHHNKTTVSDATEQIQNLRDILNKGIGQ